MGQEIQTGFRPDTAVADPFGGSAFGNFLSAIESEIRRVESIEKAQEIKQAQAYKQDRVAESSMKDADVALGTFLNNSLNLAFDDQNKIEIIKEYIVKEMGVHDQDGMMKILPKMLEHAKTVTEMKMSLLDKLFYLIMHQKSRKP